MTLFMDFDHGREIEWDYYLWVSVSILVLSQLWATVSNRWPLPSLAIGRVYWKSAAWMFVQAYVAIQAVYLFTEAWKHNLTLERTLDSWYFALIIHIWFFPFSLPLYLFCLFVNGYVLKFLYQRRDYLPEESR